MKAARLCAETTESEPDGGADTALRPQVGEHKPAGRLDSATNRAPQETA